MTKANLLLLSLFLLTTLSFIAASNDSLDTGPNCTCDTTFVLEAIKAEDFNSIPKYDSPDFNPLDLYDIGQEENKRLWYRDIENPDTTKFTRHWNDYVPDNYHADHYDFIAHFKNKEGIELAFQLGPQSVLWAYHTFVFKKMGCCYLVTRSYFSHARFTYKGYAIIDSNQMNQLFGLLEQMNQSPADSDYPLGFSGFFADNRNNQQFLVDFQKEVTPETGTPTNEVSAFFSFVDEKIQWIQTY